MRVFGEYQGVEGLSEGSVVTIGNFDGVHRGHQALVRRVLDFAVNPTHAKSDYAPVVLTFDPHPVRVLAPALAPPLICETPDKMHLLDRLGVHTVLSQRFDRAFAAQSPEAFVRAVLVDALRARHVVVGYDFTFGARRAGTTALLRSLGAELGFSVEVVEAQSVDGLVASSSKVREFVLQGRMDGAAMVLGRDYHVNGVVVRGAQRGRTLGFPTANLSVSNELLPQRGVYAGWLDWGAGPTAAVINLGFNPTFSDGAQATVEAHVIGRDDLALYDRSCRLFFSARLREEKRFDGAEALVTQIRRDADAARAVLAARTAPTW